MPYDTTNIFARILRGELPCKKISEDAYFLAFYTITPLAPMHVLVIPKGAFTDAQDFNKNASTEALVGFYKGIAKVIEILDLHKTGFRQISNCGINGGQEVPHYHVHILGGKKLGSILGKSID